MQTIFENTNTKMEKTIVNLKSEFGSIRAGRANASVLDRVMVDYYGTPTPINQLASVSIAEARILVIQPWDASVLNAISKAINADSDLYYYGQITVLSELFDFILRNDMDGVVINPNGEDYVIAREDILPQASGIEIIVENPVFRDSLDYAFIL